ncbi:MAG: riboflavin synthase [Lachnospiraceae bacterium]|nr:riboflavin synthase [Lachnospiraceae bacterium]
MFTGIVEETGTIKNITTRGNNTDITISAKVVLEGTKIGDSIAVNGVCLTVTRLGSGEFTAFMMAETMRRTGFSSLKAGSKVNLERAMAADGRFGGHIVSGHVDGTGFIKSLKKEGEATWVEVGADKSLLKYIVLKGSITIDGISLTVAKVTEDSFSVSLIPHTSVSTTLLSKKVNDVVNLENDIVAKYIERLMTFDSKDDSNKASSDKNSSSSGNSGLTKEKLLELGF